MAPATAINTPPIMVATDGVCPRTTQLHTTTLAGSM